MIMPLRWVAFCCFILSGMASVSYQMIWLRQAMTYFGVITPVNSAVLSVFMLGLAVGTVLAGKITTKISRATSLLLYAIVEGLVAVCALIVPFLFKAGYWMLLSLHSPQSGSYLFFSCVIITLILLPVCTLIGATLPLLMRYLEDATQKDENFSFLYYANLLGALLGCIAPCILIEIFGFQMSLGITATLNILAALLAAYALYKRIIGTTVVTEQTATASGSIPLHYIIILFVFGFVTLGSEVIWVKAFMPVMGPTVYSFSFILAVYLVFNALGTKVYRKQIHSPKAHQWVLLLLPVAALLPMIGNWTYLLIHLRLFDVFSIAGLCFCFGYLTPKIIDEVCQNNPQKASLAYTYNCIGCIAGPLFTTYVLFTQVGIKGTLIFYACLLLLVAYFLLRDSKPLRLGVVIVFGACAAVALCVPDIENKIEIGGELHRDHVGYIGAVGKGMDKSLLVNGIGMTALTTVTKNMAHLPLLQLPNPKSVLVICFGMGTTVRSLTDWPLDKITAVELSKGVTESFGYFHEDANRVLSDPRVHIVVDDGRRFLNRSQEKYDVIIIDPPPPIEAAGSGLLYTAEFLEALKPHLVKGGILQHWIPGNYNNTVFANAAINAIKMQFKYVRIYTSIENWGIHITASDYPLPVLTVDDFLLRLPTKAVEDLREWKQDETIKEIAEDSLQLVDEKDLLDPQLSPIYMSDDRLYNEFYLLRQHHLFSPK